ncbi:glutathione transferase [Diplodia corticola]|uniref:Glutathione transferase n=1 Tax=Diplodia corticola TaxID=236234 RepID=A0A1J9S0Z1_9PEZI|nr:glutathione transferase [Diplodia corticola]OJD38619.1 glutathione transferase [Diplodia corticola]
MHHITSSPPQLRTLQPAALHSFQHSQDDRDAAHAFAAAAAAASGSYSVNPEDEAVLFQQPAFLNAVPGRPIRSQRDQLPPAIADLQPQHLSPHQSNAPLFHFAPPQDSHFAAASAGQTHPHARVQVRVPAPTADTQDGEPAPASDGKTEGLKLVLDPPRLEQWRERLFHVHETIVMTEDQYQTYWPHVDNIYSHRSTQRYKRKPFVSHYWDCRLKGRPPGTPKSEDPSKKKRKRIARERDLCDVKIKITEYEPGSATPDNAGPLTELPVPEAALPPGAPASNAPGHLQWPMSALHLTQPAPPDPYNQKIYTIQRVNGNGANGKGDGNPGPHKHDLEESDRIKKSTAIRRTLKNEKERKKQQHPVSCISDLGSTLDPGMTPHVETPAMASSFPDINITSPTSTFSPAHHNHMSLLAQTSPGVATKLALRHSLVSCLPPSLRPALSYQRVISPLLHHPPARSPFTTSSRLLGNMSDKQQQTDAKKTYHTNATGNALNTVKKHAAENELKLFGSCFCPFVQRVWISLVYKDIPYQYVEVDPYKKPQSLLEINPRGLVPALRHGDWGCYESTVLMEYLEDLGMGRPLMPSDPKLRANCRLWSDHINRHFIPGFYRFLQEQDAEKQVKYAEELKAEIGKLVEAADEEGPFFLGKELSFVDVQMAPWVIRLNRVLKPYRSWPEPDAGSRWGKWMEAIENDPHVQATTSTDSLYLDSYERYAENRPNTSQLANAVNSGRGLP